MNMQRLDVIGLMALVAYNVIVLIVYGADKWKARAGRRRTPERSLLWLAACLGGPGALAGMYLFRHKTQKPRFAWGVPALFAVQAAAADYGRIRGWW